MAQGALLRRIWPAAPEPEASQDGSAQRVLSLGSMAQGAIDQVFMSTVAMMAGIPRSAELRRISGELAEARDLFARRGWLDDPAAYHRQPKPLVQYSLEPASLRTGLGTTDYQHLTFESGYRPHRGEPGRGRWADYEENRTAHAYVFEHEGRQRPWLVCVHAFLMGSPLMNVYGFDIDWLHKELGLNIITPVLPLHGPRKPGLMSGAELLSIDYMNALHGFAQATFDLRRSIGWLRQRGARKIGLYGLSLGAYNAALAASLEDDLECVVAGIPAVDFTAMARDNENLITRGRRDAAGLDWQLIDDVVSVAAPLRLKPRVAPGRRFIFAGLADRMAPPAQARALWRHWERPETHWYQGSHVAFRWIPGIRDFVGGALTSSRLI